MADINNSTSTTLVSGTSSADKIYNSESNVTIAGDAGNDFIYTDSWEGSINGGAGNDTISLGSNASNNVIRYNDGDGNDVIYGFNEYSTLKLGTFTHTTTKSGKDIIVSVGKKGKITLKGAATLDAVNIVDKQIEAANNPKYILLTSKADTYTNTSDGVTIDALEGNDTIQNGGSWDDSWHDGGSNVSIDAGAGNDYIENDAENVTINAGAGNDTIWNSGSDDVVAIFGGAGNDYIENGGSNSTIDGGDGDDTIFSSSHDVINAGAGNDYIESFIIDGNSGGIIDGGDGNDTILTDANDVTGGSGNDRIDNFGSNVSIDGGSGNDRIDNFGSNVSIDGGSGNDKIYNVGWFDEDSVWHETGNNVTLNGGAGNDTIYNDALNVTIDGGTGNDRISLGSFYDGLHGNVIRYNDGDGNDVIYGFNEYSTLKLGTFTHTTTKSGNDIIVSVGKKGKITLKGAASLNTVNIFDKQTEAENNSSYILLTDKANNYTNTSSDVTIDAEDGNDSVSNSSSNVSIDGGTGNDSIVNLGDDWEGSNVTIDGGEGNDTLISTGGYGVTMTGGAGKDVFVYGGDTATITDYATEDKISLGSAQIASIRIDGSDIVFNFGDKNYYDDYDESLTLSDAVGKKITFLEGKTSNVYIFEDNMIFNGAKTAATLSALSDNFDASKFNASNYSTLVTIDASAVSDDYYGIELIGNANNNVLLAGNNATLTGGAGKDVFVYSGGNATITDYEASDKISLNGATPAGFELEGNDLIIISPPEEDGAYEYHRLRISNAKNKQITFAEGKKSSVYIFEDDMIFNGGKTAVTLTTATSLNANDYSALVTIDASANDDYYYYADEIVGNAKNNVIVAGNNAMLTGGKGKDTFVYSGGNVTITDYEISDKISLGSAQMYDFLIDNDDVILVFGNNDSLTLKDAAGKKITFAEGSKSNVYIFEDDFINGVGKFNSGKTAITVSGSFNASDYSALVTIDASAIINNYGFGYGGVEIIGNAKANRIIGTDDDDTLIGGKGNDKIFGNAGDDSLWGGAGSDVLYGGDGADTFFYAKGDGKDTIIGFGNDDLLEITGLTGAVAGTFNSKGDQLTLKVGKTTVAVFKEFTATTFNVDLNGTRHQITK